MQHPAFQDSRRIRCDSLSAGSGFDQEMLNPCDRNALDPGGSDPVINLEPTAAEVAQCEAEVGTLLSIIAELNKTMGSLKAPRWAKFLAMCKTVFSI